MLSYCVKCRINTQSNDLVIANVTYVVVKTQNLLKTMKQVEY